MRRVLLWASAAWTLGYAAVYVAVAEGQDGGPAVWYLVLLLGAAALLAGAALRQIRVAHVAALIVLLACTALGLLSVGLLLLPAAAASAVALVPPTGRRGAPPRTDDPLHWGGRPDRGASWGGRGRVPQRRRTTRAASPGRYGATVSGVRERIVGREPFGGHDGASGARLERARLDDGAGVVLKTFDPSQDLTMRVSGRTVPLDVVLWQTGVLDRLPPTVRHAVLDAWQEDGAWVVAMRDLGGRLLSYDSVLSREECRRLLAPAVAMHAAFAGEDIDGLWSLEDRLSVFAPRVIGRYAEEASLAAWCLAGWERFADLAPADVVELVAAVHAEPGRLARPLLRLGERTLLHGDYWTPNLAPTPGGVVVIDWALATAGPPVVEFASFLVGCAGQILARREEILDDLRELWGARSDETVLRLGLAVGVVEMGWNLAWHAARDPDAREPFDWWVAAARRAAETGLIT